MALKVFMNFPCLVVAQLKRYCLKYSDRYSDLVHFILKAYYFIALAATHLGDQ